MDSRILLPFLITAALSAQTQVDRLNASLKALTLVSIDDWKYTAGAPYTAESIKEFSRPGFAAAGWEELKLEQSIYPDSCWLRREVVLPDHYLGRPVSGAVRLLLSLDDYGYLWVNGEEKGHFPWDGDFLLTENAKPGMRFVLLIKAINTGGPLRLLRARITFEQSAPLLARIEDLTLSLKVGQKLLGGDTYQTNARLRVDPGLDKSKLDRAEKEALYQQLQGAARQVDVAALRKGEIAKFNASLEAIRPALEAVDDFAKRFTLFFGANAHIDAAWLWRKAETQEVCKNTFASVDNIMAQYPQFTYTQSAACYYDWMERLHPRVFEAIRRRVQEGRWEITGGMWIEPDCNLPDGISWARQLLYARRYFLQRFGKTVKIGWNPDSFGYNWNMPQFYRNAGMDAFITQKIGWNDTNVFPYRVFWWEAPDGSRILSYFPFDYVNTVDDPFRLVDWLRQFEANTGFTRLLILFGVGDHGGGPSMEMLERIERLKSLSIYPAIEYGTAETYLNWLRTEDLSGVPVWKDELYLEYHRGTFTTQAEMKASNRKSEVLLANTEKFAALAAWSGHPYPRADLEEAWKLVMFNQFHDILPGSSIREVYVDAREDYGRAEEIGRFQLSRALAEIGRQINTALVKKGQAIAVFNPLAWERSDIVHLPLQPGDDKEYAIFDLSGREAPSQTVPSGKYQREVIFMAENVPPLGYRLFEMRQQSPRWFEAPDDREAGSLHLTANMLENDFFKVTVDTQSGWVSSIFDRQNNREALNGPGNELQLFEDRPAAWDAWNIGLKQRYQTRFLGIETAENGPLRVTLRARHTFLNPNTRKDFPTEDFPSSFFNQEITLYRRLPRIDFCTTVDWWENHTMLKVAFSLNLSTDMASYEIPYGSIRRPTGLSNPADKGKWEVAALRWADLSQADYGISLLNNSKYGHDAKGNVLRLSLLRSPRWPDPTADRGRHAIEYALYPHRGDWREAQTVRRGYEFNTPLLALALEKHPGHLPAQHSFVSLEPANLVLAALKQAEDDSAAWVVQWYEANGEAAEAALTLPSPPRRAVLSNFLEEDLQEVGFAGRVVRVPTGSNAIVTVKVYF